MKTRKIFAAAAAAALCASAFVIPAGADTQPEAVLTISDGKSMVVTGYPVPLSDADGDGAVTINDVLVTFHDEREPGGYASEVTEYGLSMTKLHGVENGGAYGYYVNDVSAMSLLDPVNDGDHVYAFVYSDTAGFSDTYSFFSGESVIGGMFLYMESDTAVVTLNAAAYDDNWNPITVPVAGAEITVGGKKSGIFTDENGKAVLTIKEPGVYNVSAVSETQTLVPPICVVTRAESDSAGNPATGVSLALTAPALAALAVFALRKRNG